MISYEVRVPSEIVNSGKFLKYREKYGLEVAPYAWSIDRYFPNPRLKTHLIDGAKRYSIVSDDGEELEDIFHDYALPLQEDPMDAWRLGALTMKHHQQIIVTAPVEDQHVRFKTAPDGSLRVDKKTKTGHRAHKKKKGVSLDDDIEVFEEDMVIPDEDSYNPYADKDTYDDADGDIDNNELD